MLNRPRPSDPVSLACELDSIEPVRSTDASANGVDSQVNGGPRMPSGIAIEDLGKRLSLHDESLEGQKVQAVAPYQALPLKGPFVKITEHLTPALDVIEPSDGSEVNSSA